MIGQKSIQERLSNQIKENKLPRFMIFIGQRGSGKRTLAKWLGKQLKAITIESETKADDVRIIIEQSYKVSDTTLYIIPDTQKMSTTAQNAMLKVTEEPPNNAYFVMTVENESQILGTLLSRGTAFRMDNYSTEEIEQYMMENTTTLSKDIKDIILDICTTPGEVTELMACDVIEFDEYVCKVVNSIAEVSGSNAFKIGAKLNLSDKDVHTKYELTLFWKAFMNECMHRIASDPIRYAYGIKVTSKYLQELRIKGINKQFTFDNWLLDIRKEWLCRE